ncbi:MAG: ATP-dependent DNA helicase RecQ [Bacteroidales bacterium]|nr:ATP-dependent DNA helicase RecQ [Bacteroidales bacterium]
MKKYWGYDSFRPLQEEIITSVLSGHDTLGLLPTGGGKSITFQVPGLVLGKLTIVVTPLISLMKDQADHLCALGIKATAIYAGMTREEIVETYDRVIEQNYHFLYISPERLHTQLFQAKLRYMEVALLVIDEAHCISQWGYDFRPPYLRIAELRKMLKEVHPNRHIPCLALTATATPEVVNDIKQKLHFGKNSFTFQGTFERPNLTYKVVNTEDKISYSLRLLDNLEGSAIVYVRSRKKTSEVAETLNKEGICATFYHAGLSAKEKEERQEAWIGGEVPVVVATNAFGMGIDKPDVRLVIHLDLPPSPEEYYQEAGRAGRDQKEATAWLLCSDGDKETLINHLNDAFPDRDFVRKVYEKLAFFYQIPIGEGFNGMHEFDIYRFCSVYHLEATAVYYSLRLLDKAGYIAFMEEPENRSRIVFTCTREHLYYTDRFDAECQRIINALLRLYTGIFADFQRISEEQLMAFTGLDRETIYQKLLLLNRFHILHYVPARQKPAILYTCRRLDTDEIRINHNIYEDRKAQLHARIKGMINYVNNNEECRLVQLLRYFGENLGHNCGKCDVCIAKQNDAQSYKAQEASLEQQVIKIVTQKEVLSMPQLSLSLNKYEPETIAQVVRKLIDQDILCLKDGMVQRKQ